MNTFFVETVLDPALAIFGVLVPLAVACVILALQGRKHPDEISSHRTQKEP